MPFKEKQAGFHAVFHKNIKKRGYFKMVFFKWMLVATCLIKFVLDWCSLNPCMLYLIIFYCQPVGQKPYVC